MKAWLGLALAWVVVVDGCTCAEEPDRPAAGCVVDLDCPTFGQACRAGACIDPLPGGGEGEGEGSGEGEGESSGEGEGEGGALLVAPASVTLPTVLVNEPSTGTVQLVNTGPGDLVVTGFDASDARLVVVTPAVDTVVASGAAVALTVRWTSATPGLVSATLTVQADDDRATLSVHGTVVEAGGASRIQVAAGPDDDGLGLPGCTCRAPVSPANVDITYRDDDGHQCKKPANLACGLDDSCASCVLGDHGEARWRSGRTETPRQGDAPWIVDEEILHDGAGDDGVFVVSVSLVDDCVATTASIGSDTNVACCTLDCGGQLGAPACYPYDFSTACSLQCQAFVAQAEGQDCMQRGPVLVRVRLEVDGVRDFCLTLDAGREADVATVTRSGGLFRVTAVSADVDEVGAGAPCP